jgi:hypothetical protein
MKFPTSALFSTLAAALLALPVVLAAPILESRTAKTIPSLLNGPATFYRAVTGKEFALATTIYKVGQSPASHGDMAGDLAAHGALYVFKDESDAQTWGNSWCKVDPKGAKSWYLLKLKYTPNPAVKPMSFLNDGPAWKTFVNANYGVGTLPSPAPKIIEAPISVGHGARMQAYEVDGKLVYQAAFVGKEGLGTLKVESMVEVMLPLKSRKCCSECVVQ